MGRAERLQPRQSRRAAYCPSRGGFNRTRHLNEPRRARVLQALVANRRRLSEAERAQVSAAATAAAVAAAGARASASVWDWPNLETINIHRGTGYSAPPASYERKQIFQLVNGLPVDQRAHSLAQDESQRAREPRIRPAHAAVPLTVRSTVPPASTAIAHRLVHASWRALKDTAAASGVAAGAASPPPSSATSPLALLSSAPHRRALAPSVIVQPTAAPRRAPLKTHVQSTLTARLAPIRRLQGHSSALCCQFRERSPEGTKFTLVLCACDPTFPYLSARAETPTEADGDPLSGRIRMDTFGREFDVDPSGSVSPAPGFFAARLRYFEEDWDGVHAKPKFMFWSLYFASAEERKRFLIATLRILHAYVCRPNAFVAGQLVGFAPTSSERLSYFAHNLKFQYGHVVPGVRLDPGY